MKHPDYENFRKEYILKKWITAIALFSGLLFYFLFVKRYMHVYLFLVLGPLAAGACVYAGFIRCLHCHKRYFWNRISRPPSLTCPNCDGDVCLDRE